MPGPEVRDGGDGRLVVVATPIGNLGDLSPRAVSAMASAGYIYCEDTRRALKLLSHAEIKGPRLVSHHKFNEAATTPEAVERIRAGAVVVLVTDAGTPLVSDPGGRLVRAVLAEGLRVEAVPGPSAVLTALVVSGLATQRWCFEGFLPRQGRQRADRLEAVAAEAERAVVVYESPYRAARLLEDLARVCGTERPAALCRELTKLHEEVWRASLGELAGRAAQSPPRGEVVVVVGPPAQRGADVRRDPDRPGDADGPGGSDGMGHPGRP